METMEISPRLATWRRRTDTPLITLAIGSIPLLLLDFVDYRLPDSDQRFLFGVDVVVFLAFAINYVVELFLTTEKSTYVKTQWVSLLIVASQFLALLPALGLLGVFRGVRALRVIGLVARVIGIGTASKERGRRLFKDNAIKFVIGLSAFTLLTSAAAFTIVEDVGEGRKIDSFFDSLWWSASIISRAGTDIHPATDLGRLIAVFTGLIGVTHVAVVTGRLAQFLLSPDKKE
jgi:voltage-gated potassium channel